MHILPRIIFSSFLFLSLFGLSADKDIEFHHTFHDASVQMGEEGNIQGWIVNNGPGSIQVNGLNVHVSSNMPVIDQNLSVNFIISFSMEVIPENDSIFIDEDFDVIPGNGFFVDPSDIVIVWPTTVQSNEDPMWENNFYVGEIEVTEPNGISQLKNNTIQFPSKGISLTNEVVSIEIFDMTGRLIYKEIFTTNENHWISTSFLRSGIYILRSKNKTNITSIHKFSR